MRGKLIFKGGRGTVPGPISVLTLAVQPQTAGTVGQTAIQFSVVVQNATAPCDFTVTGVPTGIAPSSTGPYSASFGGTYSAAGTFNVSITAVEQGTGRQSAPFLYTCVVAAAPVGLAVAVGQVLPFGSTTPAGQAPIAPVITGGGLANAIINTQDGGAVTHWQMDPATANVTRKVGSPALTLGAAFVLACTFTGQDASVVNRDVTAQVEAVAGRSATIQSEAVNAVATMPPGTNVYLRDAVFGNLSPTNRHHTLGAPGYITKHTGQSNRPRVGRLFPQGNDNLWFTWLEVFPNFALPSRTSSLVQVTTCTETHIEDCEVHNIYNDPDATYTTSTPLEQAGTAITFRQSCVGCYVKRTKIYDCWLGVNTATSPPGGKQEYWDNWVDLTGGTKFFLGASQGTYISLSFLRNVCTGWIAGVSLHPADSHSDGIFIAQGQDWTWANIEISQNMFWRGAGKIGAKGIFLQGDTYTNDPNSTASFENVKILDNIVCFDGNDQGIFVARCSGFENVIAGNTVIEWSLGNTLLTAPGIQAGGNGPGLIKVYGNINENATQDGFTNGGMPISGKHNIATGLHGSIIPYSDLFVGGHLMSPITRDDVLSMLTTKPAAGISGTIGSGHGVFPTNPLSPTGASMVDKNGNYWE